MRYIGNKTKLLGFIGEVLEDLGIRGGRALDAFAGTAAVGRFLKRLGFAVVGCDIMTYSFVFQRAYLVADQYPNFEGLNNDPAFQTTRREPGFARQVESRFAGQSDLFETSWHLRALEEVLVYLDSCLAPKASFVTKHYSPTEESDRHGRMYFTPANASRVDAIRTQLHKWRAEESVTEDEYYILLATLLEAADAVANTTGVYAAYVKTWQANALKPLRLNLPKLVVQTGQRCEAYLGDINRLISSLGEFDLLYLDPPYNTRQYTSYYHIPEIIARGWFDDAPAVRGKTGLIPAEHQKSAWSSRDGCVAALEHLLTNARAEHVLMSYNDEGIIPDSEIERLFREVGIAHTFRRVTREYARYRSDADSDARIYKRDRTTEYVYYVRLT